MIVYTNDDYYKDIADAIREKTGGEETYLPSEMGDGVRAIQSGYKWTAVYPVAREKYQACPKCGSKNWHEVEK